MSDLGVDSARLTPGQRIGRLTVARVSDGPYPSVCWRCACGTEGLSRVHKFQKRTSCGCTARRGRHITHGMSHLIEYRTWSGMKRRCFNQRDPGYKYYGARGITVCAEWRGPDGFVRFYEHIGPKPTPAHSIDRIDGTKSYEPGNVRWVTSDVQGANHPPGTYARAAARGRETRGRRRALNVWRQRRTLYGAAEMTKICQEVREELESRFGACSTSFDLSSLSVEEFYVVGDYSPGNWHTDGLDVVELGRQMRRLYAGNRGDFKFFMPLEAA